MSPRLRTKLYYVWICSYIVIIAAMLHDVISLSIHEQPIASFVVIAIVAYSLGSHVGKVLKGLHNG